MNVTPRSPAFRPLSRVDPLDDIDPFSLAFPRLAWPRDYERSLDMRMDVREDDEAFRVEVDLPGVKKEAIDVSVDGRQVTIRAEVQREESSERGRALHSERFSGQAFRSFSLPCEIDGERARADYDGGVLTLTLPKSAGGGRRVAIQ